MWQLTIKGCHVLAHGAVNKHSELEEHYAITDCLGEVIQAPCYLINQSINQKEKKNRKMGEGGGGGKAACLRPPEAPVGGNAGEVVWLGGQRVPRRCPPIPGCPLMLARWLIWAGNSF